MNPVGSGTSDAATPPAPPTVVPAASGDASAAGAAVLTAAPPVRDPSVRVAVVVPTLGRPSLVRCLAALAAAEGPLPDEVVLVDDRPGGRRNLLDPPLLTVPVPARLAGRVRVVRDDAAGPAAARNRGWRATSAPWVAFVDDDVEVGGRWLADLAADLRAAPPGVAGVQGVLSVPLPAHRRPRDRERTVAGLADACWATADMAYRRAALVEVGGFDERFPRAYREDADLALRMSEAGHGLVVGRRTCVHPVRPAPWWVSLGTQAGNADDARMRAVHGPGWRERAGAPAGRWTRHVAVVAAGLGAVTALTTRRGRLATACAGLCAAGWAAGTAEFAARRIAAGPGDAAEVAAMVVTSALIPPLAVGHWLRGWAREARDARAARRPRHRDPG